MAKHRYGFVKETDSWSTELRDEMGLPQDGPMCPWALCKHLYVPIIPLRGLRDCPERTLLYRQEKNKRFSAAVCFDGLAAFIVHNDIHDPKRQASDIAHEVGHILLRHPPANPFIDGGVREFSAEHEAEAERMGPALLISDAAAMAAYRMIQSEGISISELSHEWQVSKEVIQMRINLSGARKRSAA